MSRRLAKIRTQAIRWCVDLEYAKVCPPNLAQAAKELFLCN